MPVPKDHVDVHVIARDPGRPRCLNCGSHHIYFPRPTRRRCGSCGSKRVADRGGGVTVKRMKIKQSPRNRFPLKSRTLAAGNPFGHFRGNFKLAVKN